MQHRPVERTGPRLLLLAERLAWTLGAAALAVWGAITIAGNVGAQQDVARFTALRAAASPDLTLWDLERIQAWRDSLLKPAPPPLAVLRIPKIRLQVAVLPGTGDFVLNRAVGHIEDTALPGSDGNSGIAGHRDGFFRGLKDIATGDTLELETLRGTQSYRIERIWIVNPEDISVLDPTPNRSVTLVTCYPFYHVGPAPQRYIVRAVAAGEKLKEDL